MSCQKNALSVVGKTVLMDRNDADVSFNRDWQEYRQGFGDLNGDHWLGLQNMHLITENRQYKMRCGK